MSILQVPGATIAYDLVGSGPLLVLVAGGGGTATMYHPIADTLKDRFTVLTYDRRGFSRSVLTGKQDFSVRLSTDAKDVVRLIEHISMGPASIFGSSSGAIVALAVLSEHPDVVTKLIAHEPPVTRFHPNALERLSQLHAIYNTYRTEGIPVAWHQFMEAWPISPSDHEATRGSFSPEITYQMAKNRQYWFEHELRQYPSVDLDMEALRLTVRQLLFTMGEETPARPTTLIVEALSGALEAPLQQMPGGHLGYAVKPQAFGEALAEILK